MNNDFFDYKEISGGPRVNLIQDDELPHWWIGCGKQDDHPMWGTWEEYVTLAYKILSHPNTKKLMPKYWIPAGDERGENKEEKAVNNFRIKVHISEIDDYVKNRLLEIMMEAYDVRATNNYWACLRRTFALIELLKHLEENQVLDKYGCLYREDYVDYINDYLEKVENQTGSKKIATVQAGELNLLLKELFTKTF